MDLKYQVRHELMKNENIEKVGYQYHGNMVWLHTFLKLYKCTSNQLNQKTPIFFAITVHDTLSSFLCKKRLLLRCIDFQFQLPKGYALYVFTKETCMTAYHN